MIRFLVQITFVILLLGTGFAQEKPSQLKDQKDKVSYSIGLDLGNTFKKQNMDISPDVLVAGMKDALTAAKPLMSEEQVKETMTAFEKEMQEKQTAKGKEAAAAGEKFLAENKTKPGVKTTVSGLQYKVLREGNGSTPKEADTVKVNYRGTLVDGTEFDSSYKRGEPVSFPVNRVIKGWTEALQLMKVGSKYQVFIPATLAYGEHGAGAQIPANSPLIFEVELLDVNSGGASPAAAAASPK
ncbi:MAG: FKBP-type peptidyl-prolyl cis-trans isomerase [Chthoniobacterales bacterium]